MDVKFGPSGNSDLFYEQGYKSTIEAPKWLSELGLNAYEYQCNKGVKIGIDKARKIGEEAKKYGVQISVHAPYFINLASQEEQKRKNSIKYIIDTLSIGKVMEADRIVVHPGSCSKMDRKVALEIAKDTLSRAVYQAKELGFNIYICPETMGKINQIGTLEEIIELCKIDDILLPTIDFGHLHARDLGCLKCFKDFEIIFDKIENNLGIDRLKILHIHYSRIEYTKGGEKRHWTYEDTQYGPEFEPIAELIYKKNLTPTIICESRGTMAEDAVKLKEIYMKISKGV